MNNSRNFIIENDTSKFKTTFKSGINSDYMPVNNSFLFAIQNSDNMTVVQGELSSFTENIFYILRENSEKETLYIKAIENLLKQKEYLNLVYQASHDLISNEEFNSELENNEDKYLIKIDADLNKKRLKLVMKIIENIKYNFSDDDVSEMFSIETNNFVNFLNHNNKINIGNESSF